MSLEKDITIIKRLIEAEDIFKPAGQDELAKRQADRLTQLGPLVRKKVDRVKNIIFPRLLEQLKEYGEVTDLEISEGPALGPFSSPSDGIGVTASFDFRNCGVFLVADVDEYRGVRYTVEVDGDRRHAISTRSIAWFIIKASRAGDTERGRNQLRVKSNPSARITSGPIKNAEDLARKFMEGEVSGRLGRQGGQGFIVGDVLYSYATPIAIRKDGVVYVVDKKFSVTTTKLQNALNGAKRIDVEAFKAMLKEKGITEIGYLGEVKDISYCDKTGKVWNLKSSFGDYVRSENGKFVNFKGSVAHLFEYDLDCSDQELVEVDCPHCERPINESRE